MGKQSMEIEQCKKGIFFFDGCLVLLYYAIQKNFKMSYNELVVGQRAFAPSPMITLVLFFPFVP